MKQYLAQYCIMNYLLLLVGSLISFFSEAQTLRLTTEYYSPSHIDSSHHSKKQHVIKGSKEAFNKFSTEMINELMNRAGYTYTIDLTSYVGTSVNELKNAFSLNNNAIDDSVFHWISPIAGSRYIFISTENYQHQKGADKQLKNYKIGVYMRFTPSSLFHSKVMPIMMTKLNHNGLLKLDKKYIDLGFNSFVNGLYIDVTEMKTNHKASQFYRYIVYHINTSTSVVDRLNQTLKKMQDDGFTELIYAKYH